MTVHGTIKNNTFIVTANTVLMELKATHIGEDGLGLFAMIEEGEWPQEDGTVMTVEKWTDSVPFPDGSFRAPGLEISRTMPPSKRKIGDLEVRVAMQEGLPPGSFIPLVPSEWGIDFSFGPSGNLEEAGNTYTKRNASHN